MPALPDSSANYAPSRPEVHSAPLGSPQQLSLVLADKSSRSATPFVSSRGHEGGLEWPLAPSRVFREHFRWSLTMFGRSKVKKKSQKHPAAVNGAFQRQFIRLAAEGRNELVLNDSRNKGCEMPPFLLFRFAGVLH